MVAPCFSSTRHELRLSGFDDFVRNERGEQIVSIHVLTLLWELLPFGLLLRVMKCQVGLMVSH